ncbi:hypothetical protein J0910_30355 [Nocardiopsis sp. CNT-189]|uniref:hypothetical protein n=1 Tax=Nocardiopsis oceanisediminis TaxID=2816862 RepID=UPI003B322574
MDTWRHALGERPSTVARRLAAVVRFYRYGPKQASQLGIDLERWGLDHNPASDVERPRGGIPLRWSGRETSCAGAGGTEAAAKPEAVRKRLSGKPGAGRG